jgi:hypothetical protein
LEFDYFSGLKRSDVALALLVELLVVKLVVEVFVAEVLTQGQTPYVGARRMVARKHLAPQCEALDSLMGCLAEVQRAAAGSDRRYPALGYDIRLIDLSAHSPTCAGRIFDSRDSFVDRWPDLPKRSRR